MKLYYSSGACAISPGIALHEAGLAFTPVAVDLKEKKLEDGSDFLSINPKGQVPTLVLDDSSILTEGPAILQYIADQVPEKNLAPANGTLKRYHFQETLNMISTELHKSYIPLIDAYGYPEDAKPVAVAILRKKFDYINKILGAQHYIFGNQFTLADAYLYNVTRWTRMTDIDVKAEFSNLYAFMERMEARDSVQKTLETEGVEPFTEQLKSAA